LIVAGIDVGAATAKMAVCNDRELLSYYIMPTGHSVILAIEKLAKETLIKAGLGIDALDYVIATGYGRRAVPFANKVVTEIICHAVGAHSLIPQARTIIDIGGQDSKVIGLDENGSVSNFVMNDKCAAGTGRFLEVMAQVLDLGVTELGAISLTSQEPCQISSTCTVFAETEMVSLRADGRKREDLAAGITKAVSSRIAIMGRATHFRREVVLTGGVAKNIGVKKALEDEIGEKIMVPEEPQIIGALGAALLADAELRKGC
jgi:predicted CoA-substrate-specific enzyme activase